MTEALLRDLRAVCRDVRVGEPLSRHVSFRIGGPADVLLLPRGQEELREVLRFLFGRGERFVVLGRGSNVLVSDRGVRGVVVKVGRGLHRVRWDGMEAVAEAGVGLPSLAHQAARRGLGGLEFAAGIPGSVGGAVVMNAGAHGQCVAEVVEAVRVVTPRGEEVWENAALGFAYRTSRLQRETAVVVEAILRLRPGDPEEIRARMEEWLRLRSCTQPVGPPSSGCIFRNPPGEAAGRLIELAGCKGLRVGGVRVSTLHANYILNEGGGRALDVLRLVETVRDRVRRTFGVELELEVQLVGEF
ncbi:MAG: UDP-N-acetylmuramate dehydrogenase [Armatimonadota bacterium]|nr:UDP-N-acetylmuramate dehydrogenase [Armatimonadota bacterium]MDR7445341.1 UDP-N-acetylmuramate dehydrogenase [Armatimonadota bacterium]MDR7569822.1 UDP-N-acetylmuramate dehydrogenase [Armatimonadota bacterium]MDR7614075.1 UDP-N-acetylmuramate dehydrogenase [Armatimonadota bacterium]